jgi:hypothetical protein
MSDVVLEVNERWLYVNLRADGMYISRTTEAVRRLNRGCGDRLIEDELLEDALVHIEYCQLSAEELVRWCAGRGLTRREFEIKYLLTKEESAEFFGG